MAHVTLVERPKGLVARCAAVYSRHRFGRPVEPGMAASHHNGVLVAMGAIETSAELGWKKLDEQLRALVLQLAATRIGCSWCVDYGYFEVVSHGVDPEKVRSVADWRRSPLFDERERAVLEYAEQATATPVAVTAEVAEKLHRHLSEAQIVELAAWVALENFRSRFNGGLGLKSQGFSDSCPVPLATAANDPA